MAGEEQAMNKSNSTMTFREFLQKKAQEKDSIERRQRREEWVASLHRLFDQLRAWLAESDPDQVLEVIPNRALCAERGLGYYEVPAMKISTGDTTMEVEPLARNVIGKVELDDGTRLRTEGRVDIRANGPKYMLYRTLENGQEQWYVVDDRYRSTPLNRLRLEEILLDLLS
jgi:hypothetical protein